jgi:hypothetical protein
MNCTNSKLVEKILPDNIHVNHEYLELEIQDSQITQIRCGEWRVSGWCWSLSGKDCEGEFMTFMTRVLSARNEERQAFLKALQEQGMTFKHIAGQCIKDLESDDDSLYSLTGDNGRWHFGDSPFDHIDHDEELSYYIDETDRLTQQEFETVWENVWMEMPAITYEGFMAFDMGTDIKKITIDAFKDSNDFEELTCSFEDVRETIAQDYSSYCDESFRIGMSNCIELVKQGKYNKETSK